RHTRFSRDWSSDVCSSDLTFLADTTINIEPDAQTLAEIAQLAAERVRELGIEPRVAMLSFSNFGDAPHPQSRKVAEATTLVKQRSEERRVGKAGSTRGMLR